MNFRLKTNGKNGSYSQPHFFVLSKGDNAGRPMIAPCPNCFVLILDNDLERNRAYWICYCLWQSKQFSPFLVGSVIPFLRIREASKLLSETILRCERNRQAFSNYAGELEKIQSIERKLCFQLAKVKALKSKLAAACLAPSSSR
jgi:hypothetical protein